MDQTHIHLLITHLPVFGSILGAIVLIQGIWTKSNHTIVAAYTVLIISAIGAVIAYLTGEAAEETVEHLQGISENMIEQHEDFAVFALVSLIILGVAAVAGLFLALKKSTITQAAAIVVLFISLISFGLVARTGYLGGLIRHTEISNAATSIQGQSEESEENEESEDDD